MRTDKDLRVRLHVSLSPAEARALVWRNSGRPASSAPAVGNLKVGAVRDILQRRLNNDISRVVNAYLDALALETGEVQ